MTSVSRGYTDLLDRYPRMHVPADFTHASFNWVHTLPLKSSLFGASGGVPILTSGTAADPLQPSEPLLIDLEGADLSAPLPQRGASDIRAVLHSADVNGIDTTADAAAGGGAIIGPSSLTSLPVANGLEVVVDNDRSTLPPDDRTTAPGLSTFATSIGSSVPGGLPLKYNVRVLLLSAAAMPTTMTSDAETGATVVPCEAPSVGNKSDSATTARSLISGDSLNVLRRVRALVTKRMPKNELMLLGGPWLAGEDGGDPTVSDVPLVRAGVRHVQRQAGIDLSRCRKWVKLLQAHYHRPKEVIKGVAYPEQVEVTVILLCLDPTLAAKKYAASPDGAPHWVTQEALDAAAAAAPSASKVAEEEKDEAMTEGGGSADALLAAKEQFSTPESLQELKWEELRSLCKALGLPRGAKETKETFIKVLSEALGFIEKEKKGENDVAAAAGADGVAASADGAAADGSKPAESSLAPAPPSKSSGCIPPSAPCLVAVGSPPPPPPPATPSASPSATAAGGEAAPSAPASAQSATSSSSTPFAAAAAACASSAASLKHRMLSLDGMLDYTLADRQEKTFEVSLTAEALNELLTRDYAAVIAAALVAFDKHAIAAAEAAAAAAKAPATALAADGGSAIANGEASEASSVAAASAGEKRKREGANGSADAEVAPSLPSVDDESSNAAKKAKIDDVASKSAAAAASSAASSASASPPAPAAPTAAPSCDASILAAFRFFDRSGCGYLLAEDVEAILHNGGARISRTAVTSLVARMAGGTADYERTKRCYYEPVAKALRLGRGGLQLA